jgi:hypothetical protein
MVDYHLRENRGEEARFGSLFSSPLFHALHAGQNGRYFEWVSKGKVVASIHFTAVGGGLWRSPARGTFAGYEVTDGLSFEQLFAFHDSVEAALAQGGAEEIEILPAPEAHDPVAFARTLYLLRSRGYEICQCDLDHSLHVDSRPLVERMNYGNRKRVNKCARENIVPSRLTPRELDAAYDTIARNRASNGHNVSMTLEQIRIMDATFPGKLLLFGARAGEDLAASAICLRISDDVLYVLYWGDRPDYRKLSPVVTLAATIYEYCQQSGIKILDAGTSTIDREPNWGLISFKRALGFTESLKVRMRKRLGHGHLFQDRSGHALERP